MYGKKNRVQRLCKLWVPPNHVRYGRKNKAKSYLQAIFGTIKCKDLGVKYVSHI